MEAGAPNSGVVNMTRALEAVSPMLSNPRKTIFQVEVLVSVAAALLFLQFVLDFCKRLWQNAAVSFVLKLCNQAMFPLIVYTLGVMQTSPIKNSVYPVWAVSLIIASGAQGIIKQSDRPTVEKVMSLYIEVARYSFYMVMFSQLLDPIGIQHTQFWLPHSFSKNASSNCTSYLFSFVLVSKCFEGIGRMLFGFSYSRIVARWTRENLNNSDDQNEYNYLVSYSAHTLIVGIIYGKALSNDSVTVITIDQIWDCFHNSDDRIPTDDKKTLKDVCLSFALFELLKRRYFGWICAEASLRKTRDFVFEVLLQHPDYGYKRAFGIVETELGFCYDFLFTKHQLMYVAGLSLPLCIAWVVFLLGKVILISVVGVYVLKKSLFLETPNPIIEVHSAKADYIIALAFLYMIVMVKLLETAFYLASDWFKVSLTRTYVRRKRCAPITFVLEKALRFLNRITISARFRNRIGQDSFFSDRKSHAVEVTDAVRKAIANSLILTHGELAKGERALRMIVNEQRMFVDEYSSTLKDHSQIEVMLIWHIATDYCALALPLSDAGEDRDVAIHLSRYYSYLIVFVPELLPYHVGDIRELKRKVLEEVRTLPSRRSSEMYRIMKDLEGTEAEDNPTTIFKKGVRLGKQLENMSSNGVQIWKVMAEFWAETMIYITPSHATAKHHWEHLESGGEFLTHIWVLLSHAGILDLDRGKDQGTKPAQAAAETA